MDKSLKLVTYNIHNSLDPDEIIRNVNNLAHTGVKVFCLQEVCHFQNTDFIIESLLKNLGSNWKAEYLVKPHSLDLGLGIIWDSTTLKALSFEQLMLPKLIKLKFHEKAFEKFYSKDLRPRQKAALTGEFQYNNQKLRITNVHLDWHGGFKQTSLQVNCLKDYLFGKLPADFEIICGDFNTLGFYRFPNGRVKKIKTLLGKEFINVYHKKPTTNFLQTLDHIFVKNLSIIKTEILKLKGSDHFPLLTEIKI